MFKINNTAARLFLFTIFLFFTLFANSQVKCSEFDASASEVVMGGKIIYKDKSASVCAECGEGMNPMAYVWTFEGGVPGTAVGSGPHEITYAHIGKYSVTYEVSYMLPNNIKNQCKQGIYKEEFVTVKPKSNIMVEGFSARVDKNIVQLYWSTIHEKNNDVFSVEKSTDKINFKDIAIVKSMGDHAKELHYLTDDKSPVEGSNYYRLKYTSKDGKSVYVDTISVTWKFITPGQDMQGEKVLVVVNDKDGNELFSKVILKSTTENPIIAIDPASKIIPGEYTIVSSSKEEITNKSMIIKAAF